MKILIVGAGALGGYFGGRLIAAGKDVTFLVRPRRREQLQRTGLIVQSRFGDLQLPPPPMVLSQEIDQTYDLILVACKAFDLESTMDAFAPAVGAQTLVLPFLNGMRHIRVLTDRFGGQAILGGQCVISASLDEDGWIIHHNDVHLITFGCLREGSTDRARALAASLSEANFDFVASDNILQEMWEKWIFIASAASLTTLMRATVGDIVQAGGTEFAGRLYAEAVSVGRAHGFEPRKAMNERFLGILTAAGSPFTASMLRDIERGHRTEAEQIAGELVRSTPELDGRLPLLELAVVGLRAYEAKRHRLQSL